MGASQQGATVLRVRQAVGGAVPDVPVGAEQSATPYRSRLGPEHQSGGGADSQESRVIQNSGLVELFYLPKRLIL